MACMLEGSGHLPCIGRDFVTAAYMTVGSFPEKVYRVKGGNREVLIDAPTVDAAHSLFVKAFGPGPSISIQVYAP